MKINNKGNKSFQHQPMSEINVTPLVDVMLVLLIIFMITAPLLTTGVSVELPTTESKAVPGQDEPLTITINKNREIFIGDNIVKAETLIWLGIRPETIVFGGEAKNMPVNFSLEVEVFEPMGADTLVWSQIGGQEFRFMVDGNTSVSIGDSVTVGFDPAHASIFDFDNEERL